MKIVSLMRHAKSSWQDISLKDFDRSLNKRGNKNAVTIGKFINSQKEIPDIIFSSSAKRTRETLERADINSRNQSPMFLDELYLATASELLKIIQLTPEEFSHVMIIGHNPGLHELFLKLTAKADPAHFAILYQNLPTSAYGQISFEVNDWKDIQKGSGSLNIFATPKLLS